LEAPLTEFVITYLTSLDQVPRHVRLRGRTFSPPIALPNGRTVQLTVLPPPQPDGVYMLRVLDMDQRELDVAMMFSSTTQIFSELSLLTHLTELPSG
jgi:hypothetical protein